MGDVGGKLKFPRLPDSIHECDVTGELSLGPEVFGNMRIGVGGYLCEFRRSFEAFGFLEKNSVLHELAPNQIQLTRFHAECFRLSAFIFSLKPFLHAIYFKNSCNFGNN